MYFFNLKQFNAVKMLVLSEGPVGCAAFKCTQLFCSIGQSAAWPNIGHRGCLGHEDIKAQASGWKGLILEGNYKNKAKKTNNIQLLVC